MRLPLTVCALALALMAGRARADDQPTKPKEKEKAAALETALFALGGTSAAYLYEAHQKIGMLGDARAKNIYKDELANREIDVSINLLKVVAKHCAAVEKTDVKDEEKKHMKALRAIIDLEVKSAEGLKAYWKSNAKEDAATYSKNRQAAWDKLEDVLGLKKKKDKEKKGAEAEKKKD